MHNVLLCLHGWGGTKESFKELRTALEGSNIEILAPDLPGFGSEPEPPCPWTTDDYADWVEDWLQRKLEAISYTLKALHILGHSHGGRIAMKLALRYKLPTTHYKLEHLYLCAPAGIRHPRHFKRILGLLLAKSGKLFLSIPGLRKFQPLGKKLLYTLIRIHDYERASPLMQQTLIEVTKEDLRPLLSQVMVPTDIFWGEDDRMTPVADGKLMHTKIPGSTLHIYSTTRHAVHRDRATEIAKIVIARFAQT